MGATTEKHNELTNLVEKNMLYHVFQPIYHLASKQIIGYEALLRSKGNDNPYNLFQKAKDNQLLYELDLYSLTKAIDYYWKINYFSKPYLLFINIYPSTLLKPQFTQIIEAIVTDSKRSISPKQIVFEINEGEEIPNIRLVEAVISHLQQQGFLTAIDDFGSKGASLQRLVELKVEFIKLDRYFSKNLSSSEEKQRLISLLLKFVSCKDKIILEGLETPADLQAAKGLGVQLGQGYFLNKPKELVKDEGKG